MAVSEVLMRMRACDQLANNIRPIPAVFRFQRTIVLASYPCAQIMIDSLVRYQSISSNVVGIASNPEPSKYGVVESH